MLIDTSASPQDTAVQDAADSLKAPTARFPFVHGGTVDESRYPSLCRPRDGYVFVVTYGRSGSTLTQNLLNSIPGYCIRGENGNLAYYLAQSAHIAATMDNYVWRREDRNRPLEQRRDFLRYVIGRPSDPWFGAEDVDPDDLRLSLMDLFVGKVLRLPEGCRVGGFKEIRFHEDPDFFASYLGIVKASFPHARFVFQKRNGESVARSGWWARQPKENVVAMVAKADSLFAEFQRHNPGICFTVQYERYAEGAAYVSELFDFLREPLDAAVVQAVLARHLVH